LTGLGNANRPPRKAILFLPELEVRIQFPPAGSPLRTRLPLPGALAPWCWSAKKIGCPAQRRHRSPRDPRVVRNVMSTSPPSLVFAVICATDELSAGRSETPSSSLLPVSQVTANEGRRSIPVTTPLSSRRKRQLCGPYVRYRASPAKCTGARSDLFRSGNSSSIVGSRHLPASKMREQCPTISPNNHHVTIPLSSPGSSHRHPAPVQPGPIPAASPVARAEQRLGARPEPSRCGGHAHSNFGQCASRKTRCRSPHPRRMAVRRPCRPPFSNLFPLDSCLIDRCPLSPSPRFASRRRPPRRGQRAR
jgi:hypothetical protein